MAVHGLPDTSYRLLQSTNGINWDSYGNTNIQLGELGFRLFAIVETNTADVKVTRYYRAVRE